MLKKMLFAPLPVPEVRKTTVVSLIGVFFNTVSIFALCLFVIVGFLPFQLREDAQMLPLLGLSSLLGTFFWVCLFFWRYPAMATVGLRIVEVAFLLGALAALVIR